MNPSTREFLARFLLVLELLAVLGIVVALWWTRSFRSQAQVRMLFWQPKGKLTIPLELQAEESARELLRSELLWSRVKDEISWPILEWDYTKQVELRSNRHDWRPEAGLYLTITAEAESAARSKELCQSSALEFCERSQELAQDLSGLEWELDLGRTQAKLEKWRRKHKAVDFDALKANSKEAKDRLLISLAAKHMKLMKLRRGQAVAPSKETEELVDTLKKIERALDDLWIEGIQDERAADLKLEQFEKRKKLKISLDRDRLLLMEKLSEQLDAMDDQKDKWSPQSLDKARQEFQELEKAMGAVQKAREFAFGQMSMYAYVFRPAKRGQPVPQTAGELILVWVFVGLLLGCFNIRATSSFWSKDRA